MTQAKFIQLVVDQGEAGFRGELIALDEAGGVWRLVHDYRIEGKKKPSRWVPVTGEREVAP